MTTTEESVIAEGGTYQCGMIKETTIKKHF